MGRSEQSAQKLKAVGSDLPQAPQLYVSQIPDFADGPETFFVQSSAHPRWQTSLLKRCVLGMISQRDPLPAAIGGLPLPRRLQFRGSSPIVQACCDLGLARLLEKRLLLRTWWKFRGLVENLLRPCYQSVLQCQLLFETTPLLHGATPYSHGAGGLLSTPIIAKDRAVMDAVYSICSQPLYNNCCAKGRNGRKALRRGNNIFSATFRCHWSGNILMCELSRRLRAQAVQAERISETIGNLAATQTLKDLARQYEAQAETLEQAESLIQKSRLLALQS